MCTHPLNALHASTFTRTKVNTDIRNQAKSLVQTHGTFFSEPDKTPSSNAAYPRMLWHGTALKINPCILRKNLHIRPDYCDFGGA